jgi:hypothetical protein
MGLLASWAPAMRAKQRIALEAVPAVGAGVGRDLLAAVRTVSKVRGDRPVAVGAPQGRFRLVWYASPFNVLYASARPVGEGCRPTAPTRRDAYPIKRQGEPLGWVRLVGLGVKEKPRCVSSIRSGPIVVTGIRIRRITVTRRVASVLLDIYSRSSLAGKALGRSRLVGVSSNVAEVKISSVTQEAFPGNIHFAV